MTELHLYPRQYKHLGGWLCLDFCNTNARYLKDGPDERLLSYLHLVSWALQMGLMTEDEARSILQEAERCPVEASAALEQALTLREALYRLFTAIAGRRQPEQADFAALNIALRQAQSHVSIVPTADGYTLGWINRGETFDWMLWPVVQSAAELLVTELRQRLRLCEGKGCGFLFLDKSKNQHRRWCEPELCGNRARVRRHYQRHKEFIS